MDFTKESLDVIEGFLSGVELPNSLQLDSCIFITDCRGFVSSHLSICRGNVGSETFSPYFDRLRKFCKVVQDGV